MFYEEDLNVCGIDVSEASVYSGMCTEIFREECVFHHKKVYCFVHLSIQEFLAALHVFASYLSKNMVALTPFLKGKSRSFPDVPLHELLKNAVNKQIKVSILAVQSVIHCSLQQNMQGKGGLQVFVFFTDE